nr:MAG TPA: hypothetical protein [Caudoviricetes sp.]DAM96397.1 MAG TPA: hypothetical protein [Caudoviricetes sp.]DAV60482.1 MAG TPA: hypothetical protein [Caudoviricetes sp.]
MLSKRVLLHKRLFHARQKIIFSRIMREIKQEVRFRWRKRRRMVGAARVLEQDVHALRRKRAKSVPALARVHGRRNGRSLCATSRPYEKNLH